MKGGREEEKKLYYKINYKREMRKQNEVGCYFKEALDSNNLIDFGRVEDVMTWKGRNITEMFDRALCNNEWLSQFPEASVVILE